MFSDKFEETEFQTTPMSAKSRSFSPRTCIHCWPQVGLNGCVLLLEVLDSIAMGYHGDLLPMVINYDSVSLSLMNDLWVMLMNDDCDGDKYFSRIRPATCGWVFVNTGWHVGEALPSKLAGNCVNIDDLLFLEKVPTSTAPKCLARRITTEK